MADETQKPDPLKPHMEPQSGRMTVVPASPPLKNIWVPVGVVCVLVALFFVLRHFQK